MKAILLAAGSGMRLGDLTKETPKALVDINGKTLLERQIIALQKNNINDIIVVTGPNNDKFDIKDITGIHDSNYLNHDVLGTMMSVIDYMDSDVIVSYTDIVFDEKILNSIIEFTGDFGIAVDLNWKKKYVNRDQHPKSEADNVVIDNENILKIRKNITKCEDNQVIGEFLGLMKLSKNGAKIFKDKYSELENQHKGKFHSAPSLEKAYLTDMLQELINSGIKISPILVNGNWWEIDTLQDLEMAKKILK